MSRRSDALGLSAIVFTALVGLILFAGEASHAQTAPPASEAEAVDARGVADTVEALFRRANELAFAENYAAAIEGYGALVDVGIEDADVEQNLGVCYARLGDLPRAIFHLERALLLRPGDEGVESTLAAAEDALAAGRAAREGEAELARDTHFARAMVRSVSERALALGLLVSVGLLCVTLVVRRRLRAEAPRLAAALLGLALALVIGLSGSGLVTKQGWLRHGTPAIVLEETVALHQSPDARSPVLETPARGGERATVLDEYEGFVRLRLGARQGWAAREHVGLLR